MAPARRPVRVDSGCWSRNLRTNNFSDSDSDSDDSSPTGRDSGLGSSSDRPPPISEDARLIKELDLSSRHDEAVFKPNPWSIAKVNAAARPQVGAAKGPQHAQSPASKRSTGNLEDAFKTQSLRPRDPSATSALKPMSAVERVSSRIANATLPRKGLETGAGSRGLIKQTSSRTQCTPAVSSNSTKSVFPTAYMRRRQASTPSDNTRTAEDPIPSHPNLPEPAQLSSFHGNYQPLPVVAHIPSTMPSSTSRLDDVVRRQGIDPASSSQDPIYNHQPGTAHYAQWAPDIEGYGSRRPSTRSFSRAAGGRHELCSSPIFATPYGRSSDFREIRSSPVPAPVPRFLPSSPSPSRRFPPRGAIRRPEPPSHAFRTHQIAMSPAPPQPTSPMDMPPVRGRSSLISPAVVNIHSPRSSKKRDAYDAFSSPDTEWSTLPAKKKGKSSSTAAGWGQTSTTKFRLPLATPMQKNADEVRPRKALFKPPPPAAPKTGVPAAPSRWKVTRISLSDALRGASDVGMNGYPSPPRHGSSPPPPDDPMICRADQVHDGRASGAPTAIAHPEPASSHSPPRRGPRVLGPATPLAERRSLPSPPRSASPPAIQRDKPCPPDAVVRFPSASEGLRDRYSHMRQRVAERRRTATELWDVLNLPSCGTVYEDAWTLSGSPEIAFVKWGGCNLPEKDVEDTQTNDTV